MAAVWYRDQHGIGQQVDVSIAEAIAALAGPTLHRTQVIGEPVRLPSTDGPAALFEAKDGYINVSLGLNRFMDQVWLELGLDDPQAAAAVWHQGRQRDLRPQMAMAIAEREKFELFMKLVEIQGPVAVAMTTEDLYHDPHLRQRGFWQMVDQPGLGSVDIPGPSFQMEQTPFAIRRVAPRLGEHTSEVLWEQLGLDAEEVKTLYIEGVVAEGVVAEGVVAEGVVAEGAMGPEAGLQK
jgi:crotonobetainyl-CoA:carnitine CoA-transferase CaiB-like acyl-CoA transferase